MAKKQAEKEPKGKRGRPPKPKEPIVVPEGLPQGKVVEVEIKDINLDDLTFEYRVAYKISDLVQSIHKHGQQFPVILRGKKPYQLIAGFRRIKACQELQMTKIKAIIRDDLKDDEAFSLTWLENEERKTLTPLDKANAVEKLKSQGKKKEEIASLFHLSERQIERYQAMAAFPDALKKALKTETILPKHAFLLAFSLKKNPQLNLQAWIQAIKEESLSSEALKKRLSKESRKHKRQKKLIDKSKDSFRLYPMAFDPNETDDSEKARMIKALEDALIIIKKG